MKEEQVKKILDKRLEKFAYTVSRTSSYGSCYSLIPTEDISKEICQLFPDAEPSAVEKGEIREKIALELDYWICQSRSGSKIATKSSLREADSILQIIESSGYVKLYKDQTLPRNKMSMASKLLYASAETARQDLIKAGWRKVE